LGLFRLFGLVSGQGKGYRVWQKDNLISKPIKYGQNPNVFRERLSNPRRSRYIQKKARGHGVVLVVDFFA
jgi:hypothetical protein